MSPTGSRIIVSPVSTARPAGDRAVHIGRLKQALRAASLPPDLRPLKLPEQACEDDLWGKKFFLQDPSGKGSVVVCISETRFDRKVVFPGSFGRQFFDKNGKECRLLILYFPLGSDSEFAIRNLKGKIFKGHSVRVLLVLPNGRTEVIVGETTKDRFGPSQVLKRIVSGRNSPQRGRSVEK